MVDRKCVFGVDVGNISIRESIFVSCKENMKVSRELCKLILFGLIRSMLTEFEIVFIIKEFIEIYMFRF